MGMSGQCSGSRVGEVLRKYTAVRLLAGAAPPSSHHPQEFLLQGYHLLKTQVLTIVKLDTIRATHAWRSTGLPTSSIGAARRKAKDVRATHHCTCSRQGIEHAQGPPSLSSSMFRIVAAFLYKQLFRPQALHRGCNSHITLVVLKLLD